MSYREDEEPVFKCAKTSLLNALLFLVPQKTNTTTINGGTRLLPYSTGKIYIPINAVINTVVVLVMYIDTVWHRSTCTRYCTRSAMVQRSQCLLYCLSSFIARRNVFQLPPVLLFLVRCKKVRKPAHGPGPN
jgi:hypothetical protein